MTLHAKQRYSDPAANAEIARLRSYNEGLAINVSRLEAENERLRSGYSEIMKATVEGRVCDDVAWFSTIETLYDFCDHMLHGDKPRAAEQHGREEGK